MTDAPSFDSAALTAEIVTAYVANNAVPADELPKLIDTVHAALVRTSQVEIEPEAEPLKPAVPIKKSVQDDYIVCLEDGKRFKSLKRHLRTSFGMTPDEYREKWGLPSTYPMVAPAYAAARSALAKEMGLGRKAAEAKAEQEPAPEPAAAEPAKPKRAPRKRTAKPKAAAPTETTNIGTE